MVSKWRHISRIKIARISVAIYLQRVRSGSKRRNKQRSGMAWRGNSAINMAANA